MWNQVSTAFNEQKRIVAQNNENNEAFWRKLRANGYTAENIRWINSTSRASWKRSPNAGSAEPLHDMSTRSWTCAPENWRSGSRIRRRPTRETTTCFIKAYVYAIVCSPCRCRYMGSTTTPIHESEEHIVTGRGSTIHEHLVNGGEARFEYSPDPSEGEGRS